MYLFHLMCIDDGMLTVIISECMWNANNKVNNYYQTIHYQRFMIEQMYRALQAK